VHLYCELDQRERIEKDCPGACESEGVLEMTLSADLNSMDGRWAGDYIDSNCNPYSRPWHDWQWTTPTPQKVEIVGPESDEVTVGESFRVRVTFESIPNLDCPSATVRNTTSGESTVVPTTRDNSSADQPNKIICITEPVHVVPTLVQP